MNSPREKDGCIFVNKDDIDSVVQDKVTTRIVLAKACPEYNPKFLIIPNEFSPILARELNELFADTNMIILKAFGGTLSEQVQVIQKQNNYFEVGLKSHFDRNAWSNRMTLFYVRRNCAAIC